jgi:hypothetical protein
MVEPSKQPVKAIPPSSCRPLPPRGKTCAWLPNCEQSRIRARRFPCGRWGRPSCRRGAEQSRKYGRFGPIMPVERERGARPPPVERPVHASPGPRTFWSESWPSLRCAIASAFLAYTFCLRHAVNADPIGQSTTRPASCSRVSDRSAGFTFRSAIRQLSIAVGVASAELSGNRSPLPAVQAAAFAGIIGGVRLARAAAMRELSARS